MVCWVHIYHIRMSIYCAAQSFMMWQMFMKYHLLGEGDSTKVTLGSQLSADFMCYFTITCVQCLLGSPDSLLVWAPDSWSKGCEFKSRQEQRENFLFQSQLCVLTLIRCPFHPRVTTVARKRARSFCQECRWQDTPKHAYTFDPMKSEWADYASVLA